MWMIVRKKCQNTARHASKLRVSFSRIGSIFGDLFCLMLIIRWSDVRSWARNFVRHTLEYLEPDRSEKKNVFSYGTVCLLLTVIKDRRRWRRISPLLIAPAPDYKTGHVTLSHWWRRCVWHQTCSIWVLAAAGIRGRKFPSFDLKQLAKEIILLSWY